MHIQLHCLFSPFPRSGQLEVTTGVWWQGAARRKLVYPVHMSELVKDELICASLRIRSTVIKNRIKAINLHQIAILVLNFMAKKMMRNPVPHKMRQPRRSEVGQIANSQDTRIHQSPKNPHSTNEFPIPTSDVPSNDHELERSGMSRNS